jgi:hypothetical protein
MNRHPWLGFLLVLLVLTGGAIWYWYKGLPQPEPMLPVAETPADTVPESPEPAIEHPLTTGETEPDAAAGAGPAGPLPALDQSDAAVRDALTQAFGAPPIEAFLIPDRLVRRIVATIDSLDSAPVPLKQRPVQPVVGRPVIARGEDDTMILSVENDDRYDAFVSAFDAVDTRALVSGYRRYYPLFQRAYEELGYPDRYFNDRVVQIIDHLLGAPSVAPPIVLIQPKALYQFADPRLENLSWGRKLLVRIGQVHGETVKAKLREIRAAITTDVPEPQ